MSDDPLHDLASRALHGDRGALEALCAALQGPLYRLALRVFGRSEDAKDATQEALLQIVTHLSQFRSEARITTWAYTVATRHYLRVRSTRNRRRELLPLISLIEAGLAGSEPSTQPTGDTRVLARETRLGCTQAMLDCLNVEERMAIVLTEVLGADDALGARLCEVAEPTYRKRLSRARTKLAPILESLCGLADPTLPCNCTRQAWAKQAAGLERRTWSKLPVVDDHALAHTADRLGELKTGVAVFALDPPIAPPETLWAEIRAKLPSLLGPRS